VKLRQASRIPDCGRVRRRRPEERLAEPHGGRVYVSEGPPALACWPAETGGWRGGNAVALTDANGAIVEAYSYSPFGELTVHIDSEGSEVHQLRARPGEVWLELTEEIDLEVLEQAFADESASLTNTATTETIPVTLERPVATGKLAGRRIVIRPEGDPLPADTPLALHLPASSLEDLFGNEADEAFGGTFVEPTAETIIVDTAAPLLDAVVVRNARLELRFTEEPSEATWSAITLDGEPTSWTLAEDRYTLLAVDPLLPGTHTLTTPTAVTDLAGTALATPNALELDVPLTNATFVAFETPDPRTNPTSAADFRHTFHGLERDPTTGLVYARNRWYDPQMGRFVSPDPLGYVDGPSAYAYSGSDPINQADPLGLCLGTLCADYQEFRPQILESRERAAQARAEACRSDPMQALCFGAVKQALLRTYGDNYAVRLPTQSSPKSTGHPAIFVNGIQNLVEHSISRSALLSETFGIPVVPIWNPTFERSKTGALADIGQVILVDKLNLPDASVRLVTQTMRELLNSRPETEPLVVYGHSQGAAIVSAAASYLTSEELGRLEVITFGEAAWTYPEGVGSLTRFVNERDLVPLVAGSGPSPGARGRVPLPMGVGVHGLEEYVESYRWVQSEEYQSQLRARQLRYEALRRSEIERNLGKR
jgi:RHS repeat-associated protein